MWLAATFRHQSARASTHTRSLQPHRRWLDAGLALFVACAIAWLLGLVMFVRAIPETVDDVDSHTDAIVVLTGGSDRLATGLKLLEAKKADAVFVSGVNPQVGVRLVLRAFGEGAAYLAGRIEAGYGAQDTAGNAAETASWMRRHGYHSLRLVTASYHMPRSYLEFTRALPDVRIIPNPVFPLPADKSLWWRRPSVLALIIGEYNKLLLTALAHAASQTVEAATG
jgi:uncharacterized SAM-binding protein YcdF (DUF218 family)